MPIRYCIVAYIIIKYGLIVRPRTSWEKEGDIGKPNKIVGWDIFSDLLAGYWGEGKTLKKAIENWAKRNKINLKALE